MTFTLLCVTSLTLTIISCTKRGVDILVHFGTEQFRYILFWYITILVQCRWHAYCLFMLWCIFLFSYEHQANELAVVLLLMSINDITDYLALLYRLLWKLVLI